MRSTLNNGLGVVIATGLTGFKAEVIGEGWHRSLAGLGM